MKTARKTKFHFIIIAALIFLGCILLLTQCAPLPTGDPAQDMVAAYAWENKISIDEYPDSIIDLLRRNPETKDFVLQYPLRYDQPVAVNLSQYASQETVPLFLQWDMQWGYLPYGSDVAGITGCGPVCLSMAAYYLTGNDAFSPDKMITFALENGYYTPGSGSAWTLISEGAVKLGFDVTEIPLDEDRIMRNLQVDNPIICIMGPGDFTTSGHFIVMTGINDGKIQINDPNSIANSQKLWDFDAIKGQIRNLWVIRK